MEKESKINKRRKQRKHQKNSYKGEPLNLKIKWTEEERESFADGRRRSLL